MIFRKTQTQRKVFGFPCSTQLSDLIRELSQVLSCPIFVISEHSLGVGVISVVSALENAEYKESLVGHLQTEHLLKKTMVMNNEYDIAAAQQALRRELSQYRVERTARELVARAEKAGIPPQLLIDTAEGLIERAKQKVSHTNYKQGRQ